MNVLGIDIGGTGIKGSLINVETGELLGDQLRVKTPSSLKPEPVLDVIKDITDHFKWEGPLGCGYPGVILQNVVHTATNFDSSWIGINLADKIIEKTNNPTWIVNDADAAGIAEMHFGAGRNKNGVVIVLTVGTGIGSAFFTNGQLLPNTEMGLIIMNGDYAEKSISSVVRERENLTWEDWAKRFDHYLQYLNNLFSPNLFIIGGGGASEPNNYVPYLTIETALVAAEHRNNAGMIGAAMAAFNQLK